MVTLWLWYRYVMAVAMGCVTRREAVLWLLFESGGNKYVCHSYGSLHHNYMYSVYIYIVYMYIIICAAAESFQLCPILCDPIDGSSPPVSSVLGILHARILEWIAISSSRGFSLPWDWTHVSFTFCMQADSIWLSHHKSPLEVLCPKYFTLVLQNCNFLSTLYVPLRLASSVNTECLACCLSNSVNTAINCLHIVSTLTYEEIPDHLNQLLISERIKWGSQYSMWHYCTCILLLIPS